MTLPSVTDGQQTRTVRPPRALPSNEVLLELLRRHIDEVEGKRVYANRLENLVNVADDVRKILATQKPRDGWWMLTRAQMRSRLYDADKQTPGRLKTPRRRLADLVALGVLEVEPTEGKTTGLRFRPVANLWTPAGVAQSVGATSFSRRRETSLERRAACVRPKSRRTGRGARRRYEEGRERPCRPTPAGTEAPGASSFGPKRFGHPGDPGQGAPTGLPLSRDLQGQTRAHAPAALPWLAAIEPWLSLGGAGSGQGIDTNEPVEPQGAVADAAGMPLRSRGDAIKRACPTDQHAALERLRTAANGAGACWAEPLLAAAAAGAPPTAVALAAWERTFPDREPRLSRAVQQQLERSAAQRDRAERRPIAAVLLVEWIVDVDGMGWRYDRDQDPRTLAFFVFQLKAAAREVRRAVRRAPAPRPWKSDPQHHRGRRHG